jgi:hypothetical protein
MLTDVCEFCDITADALACCISSSMHMPIAV